MNINPPYKPYFIRVIGGFKPIIIVTIIAVLFVGLLNSGFGFKIALMLCLIIFFVVLLVSIIENVNFLRTFEIDREISSIIFTLIRFNHHHKSLNFKIKELRIEIQERVIVFESYFLRIVDKNTGIQIFKQSSVGGWNTKLFVEIVKKLDEINGTITDVSFVKGTYKYN